MDQSGVYADFDSPKENLRHVCFVPKSRLAVQQPRSAKGRSEYSADDLGSARRRKDSPAQGGATCQREWANVQLQLANPPASIGIANSTARRRYHDRWGYHDRCTDHRGWRAIVHAAVVSVTTASAIRTAMKANPASASDLNDQTFLSLIVPKWHGLGSYCW